MELLQRLFGLTAPVDRKFYAVAGFTLMIAKYALDTAAVYLATGTVWTPLEYLSPLFLSRKDALSSTGTPEWLPYAMVAWTLPFLWIGVSMSVRRAADSGRSAWLGLLFFLPGINYLFMLALCLLPSHPRVYTDAQGRARVALVEPGADHRLKSALTGIALGVTITLAMVGVSVFALGHYGASLFFGTPFVVGAATGYVFNQKHEHTINATLGVVAAATFMSGAALLLFALEGIFCIAMAFPLAFGAAALGALVGRAIAIERAAPPAHLAIVIAVLPIVAGADAKTSTAPLREVLTTIEVDAPPSAVWPNVIGFGELPPPSEWVFELGIAYPMRARIEGRGPGAVRHCEFSTGAFVEPITVWDEPSRLAFDVVAQPPPMKEWSPYRFVHAPHLEGTMTSKRGEFRLIALGPERTRTRIEARTWYQLEIFPQIYWATYSDALISAIHERVLAHVASLSVQARLE